MLDTSWVDAGTSLKEVRASAKAITEATERGDIRYEALERGIVRLLKALKAGVRAVRAVAVLDDSWPDLVYSLGAEDPYCESYGAGPTSFWVEVARTLGCRPGAVHVELDAWNPWRGKHTKINPFLA